MLLGVLTTGGGLLLWARGLLLLVKALRARATYGAPYREGTVGLRVYGLALRTPLLLIGMALLFLARAQEAFQPNEGTIRAGRIEAQRSQWGSVHVRFVPEAAYPGRRELEGEISGARWAIAGDFVTWSRGVRWLGLRDGHRVRYLIATRDSSGLSPRAANDLQVLEPLPRAAALLVSLARYLPIATVKMEASPWFAPAERAVSILYAIGPGYLVDTVTEGGRPAPTGR
jgi:hypothetical protein